VRSTDDNFDWVRERAACSAAELFERLRMQVEKDVETRQLVRPKEASYGFRVVDDTDSFSVLYDQDVIHRVVRFKLEGEKIIITRPRNNLMQAIPALGDDGECRLRVDGVERELWQVRMDALDDLFFKDV
jgi:hypothetical protein